MESKEEKALLQARSLFQQWEAMQGNAGSTFQFAADGSGRIISYKYDVYPDRGFSIGFDSFQAAVEILAQIKDLSELETIQYCRYHGLDIVEK